MDTPRTDAAEPQGFLIGQQDYVNMRELSRQLERELTAEQYKVKRLREALKNSQAIAMEYADEMACTPMSEVCRQIENNAAILEATK